MPNVALYARYSTDLQNSQSIDHQFNLCRQFAERQGGRSPGTIAMKQSLAPTSAAGMEKWGGIIYGCAEHYRRKTCGNGKTVQRRVMEVAVRDILAETAMLITTHADALTGDEQVNADEQSRQMQKDRLQLEKIDRRLQGPMSAIEDGLYTVALKVRFQQLEDRAASLRAKLHVSGRMLARNERHSSQASDRLRLRLSRLVWWRRPRASQSLGRSF